MKTNKHKHKDKHNRLKLLLCVLGIGLIPPLALADVLEEIVVTAQKQEEPLQEVPVSVSALSGDQIDNLGFSDLTDITMQIPSLQLNSWSPQLTIFNLRGVSQNNFVDNLEAPIAVYHDEAYIASINALSGPIFDLERVEVLRGPQGTLFGRNATGGLIHYISRGATETELNGYAEFATGSFNRTSLQGAVGGSLTPTVRWRLAGRTETADGYIEPDTSIPPVDSRAIGGTDNLALRGTLEVDFSEAFKGVFLLKINEDSDVPTGGYVFENCEFDADELCPIDKSGRAIVLPGVVSGDPHKHQNDTRGHLTRDITNFTVKLTRAYASGIELKSITNFMNMSKSYLEDGDAFPAPIVVFGQEADFSQLSEEIQLSGGSDKFRWLAGMYYMDYQFDGKGLTVGAPNIGLSAQLYGAGIIANPVIGPNALADDANPFDGRSDRTTDLGVTNFSLFGQFRYTLTDTSFLSAGLRWSDDAKNIDWRAFFTSDQQEDPILYAATESSGLSEGDTVLNRFTDDEISYTDYALHLSYKQDVSDQTMFFASFDRGIKGGNWTLSSAVSPDRFQHDEEVLEAIELGVKSDVSDKVRLNATFYNYDYQGYQNFVAIPPGAELGSPNPQIGNSNVTASGLEVELFIKPADDWDVIIGAASSSSEVDSIDAGSAPILGASLPNNPAFSFNYLVRYGVGIRENEFFAQLSGAFYGDQYLEVTNGPGTEQDAYNLSNLSIGYKAGRYSAWLWVKNLFDETYKAYSLDLGALGATTYYGPPMTTGVTVNLKF